MKNVSLKLYSAPSPSLVPIGQGHGLSNFMLKILRSHGFQILWWILNIYGLMIVIGLKFHSASFPAVVMTAGFSLRALKGGSQELTMWSKGVLEYYSFFVFCFKEVNITAKMLILAFKTRNTSK